MRKRVLVLSLMSVVAVCASLGLWHESRSSAVFPPVTTPIQPFTPSWNLSGVDTTVLGATTKVLTAGVILRGQRVALPWIFAAPQFGNPLDMDVADTTDLGSVIATLDVLCDSNPPTVGDDTLAQNNPAHDPFRWIKRTTTQTVANQNEFLVPLVPPYPWLLRQRADANNFWLSGGVAIPTVVTLNTVFTSVPWSVDGSANTATTKNGGDPRIWTPATDANCIDTPQSSTSISQTASNPVALGDTGGPCTGSNCADAAIYGLWTNDNVTATGPVTVKANYLDNGPHDGTFVEHMEIETTNANIGAAWGTAGGPTFVDTPVSLTTGVTFSPTPRAMQVTCPVAAAEGLVVVKDVLWPSPATTDYYPDDNAQVFVVHVVCGTAPTTTVDKAVIWVKPTAVAPGALPSMPEQVNLLTGGADTATVTLRDVTVNNAETNVTGNEWLVAESANVAGSASTADITMAWGGTVTQHHSGTVITANTCTTGDPLDVCKTFSASEPAGQSDVTANLTVSCTSGTPQGRYSVVVKAIDAPASPLGESKAADNAQRYVLKVNCWSGLSDLNAAKDGVDDGAGLYERWIIAVSNPDSRALFSQPPSFSSDTGPDSKLQQPIGSYVERYIEPGCYWIDSDGCFTDAANTISCDGSVAGHPADGYVDSAESLKDFDMPAGIDPDGDCAPVPTLAQPGHFVDLASDQTGNCAALPYSVAPSTVITFSKNADHDCDGLPDGIEKSWGSNPMATDTDADTANDFVEMFDFTNPGNPDTDGDGFLDAPSGAYGDNTNHSVDNCPSSYNPTQRNSDSHSMAVPVACDPTGKAGNPNKDKMGDACDADNDNDGLPDQVEGVMGGNPLNKDTNGDHCVDGSQVLLTGSLTTKCPTGLTLLQAKFFRACHWNIGTGNSAVVDPEGDGIACNSGTNVGDKDNDNFANPPPADPNVYLTEVVDLAEIEGYNTNPANVDTDGDGCWDYAQINDLNGDGIVNILDVLRVVSPAGACDFRFDVNADGTRNVIDTLQVAKNQCSVHANQGGCSTAVGTPCKIAAALSVP